MDDIWDYANNIKRNQYNEMLIQFYQGNDPVFDLAKIESTRTDGQRESFSFKDKEYYALARELSSYGGHLNEMGSKYVAEELLNFISNL